MQLTPDSPFYTAPSLTNARTFDHNRELFGYSFIHYVAKTYDDHMVVAIMVSHDDKDFSRIRAQIAIDRMRFQGRAVGGTGRMAALAGAGMTQSQYSAFLKDAGIR